MVHLDCCTQVHHPLVQMFARHGGQILIDLPKVTLRELVRRKHRQDAYGRSHLMADLGFRVPEQRRRKVCALGPTAMACCTTP